MSQLNAGNLRKLAGEHGDPSGYAIARRTGLTQATISRLFSGKQELGPKSVRLLCAAYNTTREYLTGTEDHTPTTERSTDDHAT